MTLPLIALEFILSISRALANFPLHCSPFACILVAKQNRFYLYVGLGVGVRIDFILSFINLLIVALQENRKMKSFL